MKKKEEKNHIEKLTFHRVKKNFVKDWQLYSLLLLPMLYFLIFKYVPMIGNIIAFRMYKPGGPIFGTQWVGVRYFEMFLSDPGFWVVFKNTIIISFFSLLFGFWPPILFALLLNEVGRKKFKKSIQTISYLPHFLSIAIVAGLIIEILSVQGPVNDVISILGGDRVNFMQDPKYFRSIYVISNIWQSLGWGAILYLAALSGIDQELYEAARVDGANRFKQTIFITLPCIRPTIITLLILNIGSLMTVGFEKILLLYNPSIYETADVIATFVYRMGLESSSYSYATAVGLFEAFIGLTLVFSANFISRKLSETSIW